MTLFKKFSIQPEAKVSRPCDGCTKCCEWTRGVAYGNEFGPGKPCVYLKGNGCGIHPNHPEDPCKKFICEWSRSLEIPQWMKPDLCNAIVVIKNIEMFNYLMVFPAGKKIDQKVYDWVDEYHKKHISNHVILTEDGVKFSIYSQHHYVRNLLDKTWNKTQ